jgi:hypothetical protein
MLDRVQKPSNLKCTIVVFPPPDVWLDVYIYTQKLKSYFIKKNELLFYKLHDVYSSHSVVRVAHLKRGNKEACIIF